MGSIFPEIEDDRTPEEQARDLGIMPEKLKLVDVKWYPKQTKKAPDVTVTKTSIGFTDKAYRVIATDFIIPAVARIEDEDTHVLIIRPSKEKDKRAHKLNLSKGKPRLANTGLIQKLMADGLRLGKYEIYKDRSPKGDIVALPVKKHG